MWAVGVETNGQKDKSIRYQRTTKWTLPCSSTWQFPHSSPFLKASWAETIIGKMMVPAIIWPLSDLVDQFDRNIICMKITQSFEYTNVIEAEGEVYTWGVGSDFWCYDLLCLLLPGHDCEASRPEQRTSDMSDGEIQDNEQIYLSSLCCLDNNVNWQLDRFRYIDTTRVILLGLTQINLLFL